MFFFELGDKKFKVVFKHSMTPFKELRESNFIGRDGKRKQIEIEFRGWTEARLYEMVGFLAAENSEDGLEHPEWSLKLTGSAFCSASEKFFSKEAGRKGALRDLLGFGMFQAGGTSNTQAAKIRKMIWEKYFAVKKQAKVRLAMEQARNAGDFDRS